MSTHAEREERGQVLKRDHTYKHSGLKQAAGGWRGRSLHSLGLIKTPSTALTPPGLINLTCIGSTPRDASAAYFPEVDERNRNGLGGGKRGGKERDRAGDGQKGTVEQEEESKPDRTCSSAHQWRTNPCFQVLRFRPFMFKLLFALSNTIHLLVMFNSNANNAFLRECINYLGFHYCYYEGSTAARCAVSRRLSLSPCTETNSSAFFSTINTL